MWSFSRFEFSFVTEVQSELFLKLDKSLKFVSGNIKLFMLLYLELLKLKQSEGRRREGKRIKGKGSKLFGCLMVPKINSEGNKTEENYWEGKGTERKTSDGNEKEVNIREGKESEGNGRKGNRREFKESEKVGTGGKKREGYNFSTNYIKFTNCF